MHQVLYLFAIVIASPWKINCNPVGAISETSRDQDSLGNYNFGYNLHAKDGQQQFRHESRDYLGRVVGSYGLTEPDGRQRIVDYVADHNGFRARVRSNEPGLQGIDSAGVMIVKPEDAPTPLIFSQVPIHSSALHSTQEQVSLENTPSISSDLPIPIRGPYVSSDGLIAQQKINDGVSTPLFLPLTPDKPYITQSEGLYIPPQAIDDLNYSPSGGQDSNTGFRSLGFRSRMEPASRRSQMSNLRSPNYFNREALLEPENNDQKVRYPDTIFELANSEERYGRRDNIIRDRAIRYRIVHIPNGIQAIPEYDPTGIGSSFPSAMNAFNPSARDRPFYAYNPYEANRPSYISPGLRTPNYLPSQRPRINDDRNSRPETTSERTFITPTTENRIYPRPEERTYSRPEQIPERPFNRPGSSDGTFNRPGSSEERSNIRPVVSEEERPYPRPGSGEDRGYPRNRNEEEPIYQRPETSGERIYQRPESGADRIYQQRQDGGSIINDRRQSSIPRNVDGSGSLPSGSSHEELRGQYGQRVGQTRDYDTSYRRNYGST